MTWTPSLSCYGGVTRRKHVLAYALLASALSVAAWALSSSVTSFKLRVCSSGEVSEVKVGEGATEDDGEASLMVRC